MSIYAKETGVSVERSEAEIKRTLRRYGADDITTHSSARRRLAFVAFAYESLPVKMTIPLPDPDSEEFWHSPAGKKKRSPEQARSQWEKACRQQWRVLLLLIKAQLEAIANGVVTPQEAFMPWLLLKSGRTIYEEMGGGIQGAIESGQIKALPWGGATD